MSFTEDQLQTISNTWQIVVKDVGLQLAGKIMFKKLFEIQPELVNLFPFKDDALTDDNESLNKHALSVMETIDAAVHLLLDGDIPSLVDTLVELGISHGMNSVKPEHFAPVGQALVFALSAALKEQFTKEVQDTWVSLYQVVQAKMEEGMREACD